MSTLFTVIHTSICDVVMLLILGSYVIAYFVLWAITAWKTRTARR